MIRNREELERRPIEIDLGGSKGNAYVLLMYARRFAQQLSLDETEIHNDMTSGDYEHLLEVFDKHFGEYVILYR